MTEIIDKIYDKITVLVDKPANENKLKFDIESILQDSINYMNRSDFPEELIMPITRYIYKYNFDKNRNVGSMKIGDTQITYRNDTLNDDVEYKKALNRFRKVGTPKAVVKDV